MTRNLKFQIPIFSASIPEMPGRTSGQQSHLCRLTITQLERHRRDVEEHHEHPHIQKGRLQLLKVPSQLLKDFITLLAIDAELNSHQISVHDGTVQCFLSFH